MKNKIAAVASISVTVLVLTACTQQARTDTQVQLTPSATTEFPQQLDASLSGQIDISDDAVTQREATKSGIPKASPAPKK